MYAGIDFTDSRWIESGVNLRGKGGHPNIQPSTRPGIVPGTSRLGVRDLYHCDTTFTQRPRLTYFNKFKN